MIARAGLVLASAFVLGAALAAAQEPAVAVAAQEPPTGAPAPEPTAWEYSASVYGYFPPDDYHYAQPTVIANHGGLHLEARYNYEGLKAGSAWVGWNVGTGDKLRLDATLMVGGVFGDTRGVAPGLELTLSYGKFQFYSEAEYVIDTDRSRASFVYNWVQLGYSPLEWLTVGIASQRTRVYRTGLGIQRGFFVGFTYKSLSLNVYVFNPGWETPTVVSSLAVSF
jgi:hypothetical protein